MSTPRAMKVSVVIPVRNGARFLPEALEDVRRQTHSEHETIVVDGRSTDGSATIARRAGARVIEQPGDGFADAWNLGVAAAEGEAVAFLDSDDRWDPEKLAAQVEVLLSSPEVDYVITRMRFFIEPGVPYPPGFRPHLLEGEHVANMPSSLLIRRSAFDRAGPFRTDMLVANDIEWFARVKDAGLTRAVVPRVLVRKRVHDANWSYGHRRTLHRELTGLLRETVVRQRAVP